jgi:hypothetical protein
MYKLAYKQLNYKTTQEEYTSVFRLSDGAIIPFAEANTDYQAFLKYKEEGGKVYGPDEEVPSGQTSE